jgi:TrmH family RNA methyltransferase
MEEAITSTHNPLIKRVRTLHRARGRRSAGLTLIEGPIVLSQMAAAGLNPETVLVTVDDAEAQELCRTYGWAPVVVSPEVLAAASDTVHPQSPIAVIPVPEPDAMRNQDTLVMVDMTDPGNVGTIVRSAAAFGWDVCVSGATTDPWSPKVLRAGAGSHFNMHLSFSADPVADGRAHDLEIVASTVSGGRSPRRGDQRIALLVGSEAHGLSEEQTASADEIVTLPMTQGVESLNAGVAASILMYVLRGGTGDPDRDQ